MLERNARDQGLDADRRISPLKVNTKRCGELEGQKIELGGARNETYSK